METRIYPKDKNILKGLKEISQEGLTRSSCEVSCRWKLCIPKQIFAPHTPKSRPVSGNVDWLRREEVDYAVLLCNSLGQAVSVLQWTGVTVGLLRLKELSSFRGITITHK